MDMSEIAWAAGLFEGEGSIKSARAQSARPGKTSVELTMGSADRDVLDRFCAAVGGKVYGPYRGQGSRTPEHYRPMYQWRMRGVIAAQQALRAFWPYLGERRRAKAADAIASYYDSPRVPQRRRKTLAY